MPDFDDLLASFGADLPPDIEKPALLSHHALQAALTAKWGQFWSTIEKAGVLARDKYGQDVRIGTRLHGYDIPNQTQTGSIDLSRPGKPNQSIIMISSLQNIVIDGVPYDENALEGAAALLLARFQRFLTDPIDPA
jgi:hypothetical protein